MRIEVDHVVGTVGIETHRAERILALVARKNNFLLFMSGHLTIGLMLVGWLRWQLRLLENFLLLRLLHISQITI